MLALLFNQSFWYDVLIVVAIIGIIAFCAKYPNGKVFVFTFLGIGLTVFTAYAGVQLNYYYKASGGVYGYITGLFKPNEVTVENAEFTFSNMELKQINGKDEYGAYITTDDIVSFENGKAYGLFINKMPAKTTSFSTDYIQAQYSYAFYDNQRELLMQDTLYFNFAFHTNSTNIEIFSKGGSEAVKYWNYWFNKNVFVASIDQVNYVQSGSFNYRDLKLNSDESVVAYYLKDDLQKFEIVKNGSKLSPNITAPDGIKITGWKVNGQTIDLETYTVSSSVNLIADWEDMVFVELRAGAPGQTDYTVLGSNYYSAGTTFGDIFKCELFSMNEKFLKNMTYECWSEDTSFSIENTTVVEDIPNGVIYVRKPTLNIPGKIITTDSFDRTLNQYTYSAYAQSNEIELGKIRSIQPGGDVYFEDVGHNRTTALVLRDFAINGNRATFSGTKTWTTSTNETIDLEFNFGMVVSRDFNITFTVSENLMGSLATDSTFGVPGVKISLTIQIEFTEDIFYLV